MTRERHQRAPVVPLFASERFFADSVPGRRGQILDAALAVFSERGYDGGSMREIAMLVGVTEPALYRHFEGKEQLFTELIERAADRFLGEATRMLDEIDPEHLRDSVARLLSKRKRTLPPYLPVLRTVIVAASHDPQMLALSRERLTRPVLERLTGMVRRVDAHLGLRFDEQQLAVRVRTAWSLVVGYLITSMLLDDATPVPIEDAVLRELGWEDLV